MSEEIISAIATIKGAQIQAYYTLIASCVGAVGIVVGIILSWYTALHLKSISFSRNEKNCLFRVC